MNMTTPTMRFAASHPKAPKKPSLKAVPAETVICSGSSRRIIGVTPVVGGGKARLPHGGLSGSVPADGQPVGKLAAVKSEVSE